MRCLELCLDESVQPQHIHAEAGRDAAWPGMAAAWHTVNRQAPAWLRGTRRHGKERRNSHPIRGLAPKISRSTALAQQQTSTDWSAVAMAMHTLRRMRSHAAGQQLLADGRPRRPAIAMAASQRRLTAPFLNAQSTVRRFSSSSLPLSSSIAACASRLSLYSTSA